MPTLIIIVGSTRPGRVGLPVARWFEQRAREHGGFDVELVDLAELALPFLDEPKHPRFHDYCKPHTLRWSEMVEGADAFVLVTAEYNHGYPAPLKNIPFVQQFLGDGVELHPNDVLEQAADAMLDELLRTEDALRALRVARAGA